MNTFNECKIEIINEKSFIIKSDSNTNFFIDNLSSCKACTAPFYYDLIDFDFTASVKIEPEFRSTYDAGAILIYDNEDHWIKVAFELTDLGYPSVVTVVTDNSSDDCNGEQIKENAVWLRILRKNIFWSIHYSLNGKDWKMVRYFELNLNKKVKIGVISQSPTGNGCKVIFKEFSIKKNIFQDMRKGE